jgi:hypothetical protein
MFADVVWPALLLLPHLNAWYTIGSGLFVEILVLGTVLKMSPRRAILAGVTMNLASTIVGTAAIPLMGVVWEIFPGLPLYYLFNLGTFNPITWCATFAIASSVNALLELFVLRRFFGIPWTKRTFVVLAFANALSVGIAFYSLYKAPPID